MTPTRAIRWRAFLLAAITINVLCFALVRAVPRPAVALGAAFDVAVTVPLLYLLLIVRGGLQPAISAIPLCLLGRLRATCLAPGGALARPAVLAAVEIAVIALVAWRVRSGLRAARGGDVLERIERAAREIVPSDRAAAVLAGELAAFWYAFASWRRAPEVPAGARAFPLHRDSGAALLFGFLAGVSAMEAALVHLVVARYSAAAAWTLTALSLYGSIWLVAAARSFVLRPVLLTQDEWIVRAGLLWTLRVPRHTVTVERPGAACDLRLPPLGEPKIVLRLREPAVARGLYGRTRRVSSIGLGLDDSAVVERSVLN